jgi:hypothetical protein
VRVRRTTGLRLTDPSAKAAFSWLFWRSHEVALLVRLGVSPNGVAFVAWCDRVLARHRR